jgi:hypothetical protein
MTRRKREITGLANEQDFPHLVELAVPPGGFRDAFLEFDAFHQERRIPVRRGRSRHEAERILYSILLPRRRHCGCISQSLRWRVLDLHIGAAQVTDLGYVVRLDWGQGEVAMSVAPPSGQNRIMIYGPKNDGTYIVEFRTADGEALAISVPASETRVLKHFQKRMPYGLFVPDVA